MATFQVNGRTVETSRDMNLLDFLREELDITSVKNGCSEGACGACMVLLDGKASRACLFNTAKLEGRKVVTVEGLTDREKDVFSWSYANAGAVQCGFCMPGMVISTKAILDANPDPRPEEISKALGLNVCRCTGYVKIEKAVLDAGRMLREGAPVPSGEETQLAVGERICRTDAREKALGEGKYVDDMKVPGMLHGAVLRPPKARVKVLGIDASEALAMPGVVKVITAADVPGDRHQGHIIHDWPAMIAVGEETRYVGDALALVAAESRAIAREAVKKIKLDCEVLPPLVDPRKALLDDAPRLHPKGNLLARTVLRRGDPEKAIAEAAHVIRHTFTTPETEHAFMEPESALAVPGEDGTMTLYTGTQSIYDDHKGIVGVLGVPPEKVKVVSAYVGGGFGGKEDLIVQHHAALLANATGRPVKVTLARQESIKVHPKRHAFEMAYTVAADAEGRITAVKAELLEDTGAYASLGGPVLQRACTHAAGPYRIPNIDIVGTGVYTNNPPGGAFRGFGVTQSCFAMESCINELAGKVGLTPWQIRWLNAVEPGDVLPNGQICDAGTAFKETLLAVKDLCEARPDAGVASAMKNAGIGVGLSDVGRVRIRVKGGKAVIYTSAACIGQGLASVLMQYVADASGLGWGQIEVAVPDTSTSPNGGTTTASRQTVFNGEAARLAAEDLKRDLATATLADLEGREYYREYSGVTDPFGSDKPNPVSHVAYSFATQVVLLDAEGRLEKVVAAHDVGRAVNPAQVEAQIEGGVVMGLGYALTEDFPLKDGEPQVKYGTLGLFKAAQVPPIEPVIVEKNPSDLAYGAKGLGEITTIPTAPAVACAYLLRDGGFRTDLPLAGTPYSRKKG
ncbi:selenium-dependent xanthine dehydrogenase [Mesoterricola sediminis]|uniref:Xanthine dehydrogenase, molybdopterin-binding subunit n=1 Tax=Mesoterricola sediminis TaxID=2927980 RepID=A0AA48GW81_9BACT|nr:selenium-dependent xanthine dehydrogenase [Mesoterricola sediminis]BDU78762.1 xanthine dehydrogenase, molybdopterin-binding subunit [Mesoterricola sediminis]